MKKKMILCTALSAGLVLVFGCRTYGTAPPPEPEPAPAPAPAPSPAPEEPVPTTDQALHDDVHEALERAPGIDASTIRVRVENGNVYLSGWVRTSSERDSAHDVAHAVDGVQRVFYDDLEVR